MICTQLCFVYRDMIVFTKILTYIYVYVYIELSTYF